MIPLIGEEEYVQIKDCLDSKWLSEGTKADQFLRIFKKLTGAKYAVLAPNGTLALYMALKAVGVGEGDYVMVPDSTFMGSATAVVLAGATPVFVDVNLDSWQLDFVACKSLKYDHSIRAIMPVHLCGHSVDMPTFMEMMGGYAPVIIEDACQTVGVTFAGKHTGTFGKVGAFSFYSDKSFTMGEGGAVITDDPEVYAKLRYLRCLGRLSKGSYVHVENGFNFYITDLQAAIGIAQLERINKIKSRKMVLYQHYRANLLDLAAAEKIHFPVIPKESSLIPFRMFIRTEALADDLIKYLASKEIGARGFYYPLHRQPCFSHLMDSRKFPNADLLYHHALLLPLYPDLTEEQVDYVCAALKEYF